MASSPGDGFKPSKQQETSFTEKNDRKISTLQKMVEIFQLISSYLAIAFFIVLSLLIFGATKDTLQLLLNGIIESLISVLLIFIFRHQLFPPQKDELERIGKVVDAQLDAQDAVNAQLTNIRKQLKRQEKEIVSLKKKVDMMAARSDKEYVALRTQVEQEEDNMSLTHSK